MTQRVLTRHEKGMVTAALLRAEVAEEAVCKDSVEECALIRRTPTLDEIECLRTAVAYVALRTRASGITLGDRIYIRSEYYDHRGRIPLKLIAHEVAHVAQFRRDGATRFLTRYLWEYGRGMARGLGDRRAYLNISYEVEARQVADIVEDLNDAQPPASNDLAHAPENGQT